MTTLYELLGVPEDATDAEIKRGYRRAAMKAHPDRNVGCDAAHARFQEINEAYAILSDPAQRRVYDTVYAEEMRRHAHLHEEEARRQAERDAQYAERVALAMRFAEQGHNRDVVFGVLLGRDCEVPLAEQIANSVVALHASRQADASRGAACDEQAKQAASTQDVREPDGMPEPASADAPKDDARRGNEHAHTDFFSALWHGVFGLRQ